MFLNLFHCDWRHADNVLSHQSDQTQKETAFLALSSFPFNKCVTNMFFRSNHTFLESIKVQIASKSNKCDDGHKYRVLYYHHCQGLIMLYSNIVIYFSLVLRVIILMEMFIVIFILLMFLLVPFLFQNNGIHCDKGQSCSPKSHVWQIHCYFYVWIHMRWRECNETSIDTILKWTFEWLAIYLLSRDIMVTVWW